MPIPAIVGLVLIVAVFALIFVRRAWRKGDGEAAPDGSMTGTNETRGGGD